MKDNPDSGRIMDVFRGGPPCTLLPHRPRNFCSEYILWRRQWAATAAEQRADTATAALSSLQQRQVYKRLPMLT